jgi:hypothetical protein
MTATIGKLLFAVALAALVAACASTPRGPLEGGWKNTGSRVHFSDGTSVQQSMICRMEFSGSRSVTECDTPSGRLSMVRANREIAPGQIESEIVENRSAPHTVGRRARVEYRIERGTLFTTAYPVAPKDATTRFPIRVEATWIRE